VNYGANSLTVVTNLGTTTFSNVSYQGTHPTSFTVSKDAATGLQRITFTAAPAPTVTTPNITGSAQEGQTLQTSASAGAGDTLSYQWYSSADGFTNPIGAGADYVVQQGDEGHQIEVVATATNADDVSTSATSAPTLAVSDIAPTLSVSVSGKAQDGATLNAVATANDSDALITYHWQVHGAKWTNIAGATGASFLVTEAYEGMKLRVVATSTDADGTGITAVSSATRAVTDAPPVLTVANRALTLPAGGTVRMGISVSVPDADDSVSVTIAGLTSYESVTDAFDHQTFSGASITLTAAQVDSGLTLNSTYAGGNHPKNALTIIATNTTANETVSSKAAQITVTDPPAAPSDIVALLGQYAAGSFPMSGDGHGPSAGFDLTTSQAVITPPQLT
jgi:hypothetical protein